MKEQIKVLIKKPFLPVQEATIPNTLKGLQDVVEGYIETVTLADDCFIICNEEGRILGLPYNCRICGVDFVGPIALVGADGEETTDVPVSAETFEKMIVGGA